jgi:hypothetical protein
MQVWKVRQRVFPLGNPHSNGRCRLAERSSSRGKSVGHRHKPVRDHDSRLVTRSFRKRLPESWA